MIYHIKITNEWKTQCCMSQNENVMIPIGELGHVHNAATCLQPGAYTPQSPSSPKIVFSIIFWLYTLTALVCCLDLASVEPR